MPPPTKPVVPPPALRSGGQADFSAKLEANLVYQQTQADYNDAVATYIDTEAQSVAANAVAANLGDVDFSTIPNQLLGINAAGDAVQGYDRSPIEILETKTFSGGTDLFFDLTPHAEFAVFDIRFREVPLSNDELDVQVSTNSGVSWITAGGNYTQVTQAGASNSGSLIYQAESTRNSINILEIESNQTASGKVTLNGFLDPSQISTVRFECVGVGTHLTDQTGVGRLVSAVTHNGIRFRKNDGGTIASGSFSLYGIRS